jgi:hypothetical protein
VREKPTVVAVVRGAIVHHTAGTNRYTKAQVPGILRGIMNYHVKAMRWDDIAYNFLIDKFGGIWEGRGGGLTKNIRGAHANHFNDETVGVSVLGDYEQAPVPDVAVASLKSLLAWRLAQAGIARPGGLAKYKTNGRVMPVVIGHRDAVYQRGGRMYNQTTCPGRYLNARLAQLRALAPNPLVGRPVLKGPDSAQPEAETTYKVAWDSWVGPVTGTVFLERYAAGAWTPVAKIDVVNGTGRARLVALDTFTYRARAVAVANPAGFQLPKPKASSASVVTTRVVETTPDSTPRLIAPSFVQQGKKATLVVQWQNQYSGKASKLELQKKKGKLWKKVKTVKVSGTKRTSVTISSTAKFRLKPAKAALPRRVKAVVSQTAAIRAWN